MTLCVFCPLHSSIMSWHSSHLPILVLVSFLTLLVGRETVSGFRICSYNVHKFDFQKALKYRLVHTLTRIVYRCDICLLQNVVDPDRRAINSLLSSLNRESARYDGYNYKSVSSKGLGNSPDDMQQYVFIYRTQTVNVTDRYQYESKPRTFVREPFAVQFQSENTAIKKFALVALHTEPTQAVQEIDQLYDVFEKVSKKWNNANVMFLGDFHAGCGYMTRSDKKNIRLFTNSKFSWLIGDKVDTTVNTGTNCPFERIVVHGKAFLKEITPFSAKVYNFGKELKLSRTKVMEVSENYPVEVMLKSPALLLQATPITILLIFSAVVHCLL
uniref:Deoxyribonuclease-1-like 1 n=2 Tax=Scophthalmus maximus TaxID=52904 RepID=A0A8D3AZ21_SCOMX